MTTILITDGESPAALAATRSLGRRGLRVEVASAVPGARATRSRYCAAAHVCPDPGRERDAFVAWARGSEADLCLPATDLSLVPLLEVRDDLAARLVAPTTAAVRTTLSKSATAAHATAHHIPIPSSIGLYRTDAERVAQKAKKATFPVVVKPDISKVWTPRGAEHLSVGHAANEAELEGEIARLSRFGPVFVQAHVPGDIVAIATLADRGELLTSFQYRRLHQVPPSGGASSYRISEALDPALERHVAAFLGPLDWTGLAMFEFKVHGDQIWMIEVNGRLWGSLALPVASGADFPAWLIDLLLDGRRDFPDYRVGVRCRAMAKEVAWFKAIARHAPGTPSLASVAADTARALDPRERWDDFALDDPLPAVAELADITADLTATLRRRTRRRLVRAQLRARRRKRPWRDASSALVVCQGNIIRSVYGAALLHRARPSLRVTSAGLAAQPGRSPHERTLERAARHGIRLAEDGATPLTEDLMAQSDLVFAMTIDQAIAIRDRFGDHPGLLLLGDDDIPDPDGCTQATFDRVFAQVEAGVAALG